jgi:hypothetical protein
MSEIIGDQWDVVDNEFGGVILERPNEYALIFDEKCRISIEMIASWLNRDEREVHTLRAENERLRSAAAALVAQCKRIGFDVDALEALRRALESDSAESEGVE